MAVPGAIALGKELTDNRFAGQGRERDRGNKFFSGRRNDHLHLCTTLNQSANNIACFMVSVALVFRVKSLFRIQL